MCFTPMPFRELQKCAAVLDAMTGRYSRPRLGTIVPDLCGRPRRFYKFAAQNDWTQQRLRVLYLLSSGFAFG